MTAFSTPRLGFSEVKGQNECFHIVPYKPPPWVWNLARGGSRLKCPESDYSFSGLFFAVAQPERNGKRNGKISIKRGWETCHPIGQPLIPSLPQIPVEVKHRSWVCVGFNRSEQRLFGKHYVSGLFRVLPILNNEQQLFGALKRNERDAGGSIIFRERKSKVV